METLYDMLQGSVIKQNEITLQGQKIQENSMILQQNMQAQQQTRTMNQAMSLYDPANPSSLDLVAGYLAKNGGGKDAMAVMEEKQKMQNATVANQFKQVETFQKQYAEVGGIAAGIHDDTSYEQGKTMMRAMGVNPEALGITGGYEENKGKLEEIAQGSITASKQVDQARQAQATAASVQREKDLAAYQIGELQVKQQANQMRAQEIGGREKAREEAAKRQVQLQNGATQKLNDSIQKIADSAPKHYGDALSLINADPDLANSLHEEDAKSGNPAKDQKKTIAKLAATRAMQAIAERRKSDPSAVVDPADVNAEIESQLEKMKKDGTIKKVPQISTLLGVGIPGTRSERVEVNAKAGGPSNEPTQTPAGKLHVKTDTDYAKVKSGQEYIAPDGSTRRKP